MLNFASGVSSIIGAIIAISIGQSSNDPNLLNLEIGRLLAFSSGILLYVAVGLGGELPKVKGKASSLGAWMSLFLGVIIIGVLRLWDVHCEACGSGHSHGEAADSHAGH